MRILVFLILQMLALPVTAKRSEPVLPLVVNAPQIEGCDLKADVSAKSGWSGLAAEMGIRNAKKAALKKAARVGATHVVWDSVLSGFLSSVSGRAFNCENQTKNLDRIAKERDAREKAEREDAAKRWEAKMQAEVELAARLNMNGSLRAYPLLAAHRYQKCALWADEYLQVEMKENSAIFELGLDRIRRCASEEERLLTEEVRLALGESHETMKELIKDLHAYTVASLRALANFSQSVIEARQDRARRSAEIDERATRIQLEY